MLRPYGMLYTSFVGEGATLLTLEDVANILAERMKCQTVPGDDPFVVKLEGKGYHLVVATFFGGWQATLHVPNTAPITYYAETVDMLELRLKARLAGRNANF